VPFAIAEGYTRAAVAAGDSATLLTLPGAGHFELIDPESAEWPPVFAAVLNMV
jgi:hypothetical protein